MENRKAFTNHVHNGFNLIFRNGNEISTIFGYGTYSENKNENCPNPLEAYTSLIKNGSDTVEIIITTTNYNLKRKIFRHFRIPISNGVIGWVHINDWLWVVNELAK